MAVQAGGGFDAGERLDAEAERTGLGDQLVECGGGEVEVAEVESVP
jgi:hypothetical protein